MGLLPPLQHSEALLRCRLRHTERVTDKAAEYMLWGSDCIAVGAQYVRSQEEGASRQLAASDTQSRFCYLCQSHCMLRERRRIAWQAKEIAFAAGLLEQQYFMQLAHAGP